MKHMRVFSFLSLLALAGTLSAEGPIVSLSDLLKQGRDRNPDIKAAYQRWRVTEKGISSASSWPNPKFLYVDEKDPSGQVGVEPLTRKHYSVAQEIPFPGKLAYESRMKHHEALIAEAKYNDAVLDVKKSLKVAFYRAASTDQSVKLTKKNVEALQAALSAAQARVASNQASASDVFMIQTELEQLKNVLLGKEQRRKQIDIELDALLDYPLDKTWKVSPIVALRSLPLTADKLEVLASEKNPFFLSASHEVNHARAMYARSRLDLAPDFDLMYEYQTAGNGSRGEGPAGRQLGISLSIPLWLRRPLAFKAGAQAHVQEAEAMAESMKNMVKKMVRMEENEVQTHLALAQNLETKILPTAQAAFDTTREQYAAGRGDFLKMNLALRTWLNASTDYQDEVSRYAEHWSELEKWVGTDLDELGKENEHAQ